MSKTIFFIDPMSYSNLELYDISLLESHNSKHSVYFFCNSKFSKPEVRGIKIFKIFNYSNKPKMLQPLSYLFSLVIVFFYVLRIKPDILHIQWLKIPLLDYYFYKSIKALYPKVKVIHTAHNILPHSPRKSDKRNYTKLYNLFDSIIVHTDNSLVELKKMICNSTTTIHIIPHGLLEYPINDSNIDLKIDSLDLKNLTNGKIVFSSLGLQSYYKGIDILIDVWLDNLEIRNNNNIILLIAGKGNIPRIDELENTPNVFINNNYLEDIVFLSYLKVSDVILLPYRKISQSGLLLTALNYEKPVIASSIGGLKDPFKHGDIGWLIEPDNIDELKKSILFIIDNPSEVSKIKQNKMTWLNIKKYYSWEEIQRKTFDLYGYY